MGIRRVGVGIAVAGATVLAALLLAVPAVGAGPVLGAAGDAPLAEAGLDQQVLRGETVRLDATGSYDPDGRVVEYEWQLRTPGGLTVHPFDPHGARTSFPATAVGRYRVSLTVTDDDGRTGTDTMYVRVGESGTDTDANPDAGADGVSVGDPTDSSGGGRPSTPMGRPGGDDGRAGVSGTDAAAAACSTGRDGFADGCSGPGGSPAAGLSVRIEGPRVVRAGHSYTYTASAGGLSGDGSYTWEGGDTGRRHTLAFRSHGEYTTRVRVDDANGGTATDRMEVFVAVEDNQRPEVEIVDPGSVSAGERLRLSVDAGDPDGRIRTTEWSPGRRVRVPTDGSSRTVRVTVTDDDGASVTDAITVTGRTTNRTIVGTDTKDVTCYFTDERQRDGRHPNADRCVHENGNTVANDVGPSRIETFRRNEKTDLHWRRTTEERLEGLEADDTRTDYGAAAASPHDRADTYGHSDDPITRSIVGQSTRVDNDESFALKDETVEDDLTGDGEVNAADWDRRHRTTGDTADVDPHADATTAFKRSVRDGGSSRADDDGALETAERASADAIRGRFAGTSIDAETRRDRVADLARRTGTDSGDGRDSNGQERAAAPDGGSGDDGSNGSGSSDGGETEGMERTDDTAADGTGSTDDTSDAGTADHDGNDTGDDDARSDGGASRHSPHGGRIVAHP